MQALELEDQRPIINLELSIPQGTVHANLSSGQTLTIDDVTSVLMTPTLAVFERADGAIISIPRNLLFNTSYDHLKAPAA